MVSAFFSHVNSRKKKSIPKRKQISKTLSAAGSVGKAFFPLPTVLCRHCTDWLKGVVLSDVRDDQTHDLFLSFQCPEECWWGKHLYSNRVSMVEPGALFLLHGNGSLITMAVFSFPVVNMWWTNWEKQFFPTRMLLSQKIHLLGYFLIFGLQSHEFQCFSAYHRNRFSSTSTSEKS